MSGVLLGLPGPWAEDNREPSDHYTTKIGGLPDWPLPLEAFELNPSLIHCTQCGSKLCLVAQVYAPLSTETLKIEERLLLVFGCLTPNCRSSPLSWRALRIQKVENDAEDSSSAAAKDKTPVDSSPVSVSKTNWWENLSDEDDEDVDLTDLSKAFSAAGSFSSQPKKTNRNSNMNSESAVKHSSPLTTQTRRVDTETPVLPCFYIYSQAESSSKNFDSICSNYSSLSVREKESDVDDYGQEETWVAENYEYDKALNVLKAFHLAFTLVLYISVQSCSKSIDREKSIHGAWFVVEETVIVQFDKPLNECAQRYFS